MTQPFSSLLSRLATVEELHGIYADAQEALEAHLGVNICMPNCGACCEHNAVLVWGFEIEAITSYLLGKGEIYTKQVLDSCEEWLTNDHGLKTYPPKYFESHPKEMMAQVHTVSSTRCPMLTIDKKCSIYEQRPLACEAFGVTTYPRGCPRPLGLGEHDNVRAYNSVLGNKIGEVLNVFLTRVANEDMLAVTVGYLPTLLFAKLRANDFANLVSSGKINPVKLATNVINSPALLYEQQRIDFSLAGDKALEDVVNAGVKASI